MSHVAWSFWWEPDAPGAVGSFVKLSPNMVVEMPLKYMDKKKKEKAKTFQKTDSRIIFWSMKFLRVSCATSVALTENNECIFIQLQLLIRNLAKVL